MDSVKNLRKCIDYLRIRQKFLAYFLMFLNTRKDYNGKKETEMPFGAFRVTG